MVRYATRRVLVGLLTVLGAMFVLFLIIQFMPGNPATKLLGPRATTEAVVAIKKEMRLDEPFYIRAGVFIWKALQADLGKDVLTNRPVRGMILNVLSNTLVLSISTMCFAVIIGIPLGAYSASHRNSLLDKVTGLFSVSLMTIPAFLKAILLLLIFSVILNWFPSSGAGKSGNLFSQFHHLVLPMLALALGWVGYLARLTRSTVLEELRKEYVTVTRAKGLSEGIVIYKATRNAIIPIIAVVAVGFGNLLGSTVLVEIVFHRPGIGYLIFNAIQARNYPVVQGGLIIMVIVYSIVSILADLSYAFIDPKIRIG